MSQQNKSIFYIDGFNLYFSLKSNNWKKYYWLNLVLLSSKLLFPGHSLLKVKYFTAPVRKPSDKVKRQQAFLNALETLETLEIIYGKYQYNEMKCFDCGRIIPVPKEKKTDVNIASQMIIDAVANKCDIQYLLTGDSDLTPPIRLIKEHFPKRKIFLICPPKTIIRSKRTISRTSKELISVCDNFRYIKEELLKISLLKNPVINKLGNSINRPSNWI
jgi:uncharacterized LabA/DUF88 family protein